MAVLGRVLFSSAERVDLPDLLAIDSYGAGDWKYFLKGLVGDTKPYILKGFDVIDPVSAIGTQSCSVRVSESAVFYPGSKSGAFYHGLEEGNALSQPLVPELRKNTTNYVYLTFSTFNASSDTRAFWDPDRDGGTGGEFTQDVNTESVLKVEINVSTGSFPANTIPVAKVVVGPVVISSITDCRDMLFRLGTGGISPDPFSGYSFRSLPSSGFERLEPSNTMTAGGDNAFQGGDKNIYSLKEWMDVVMTKFRELSGTTYWYEDLSTYSLISGFVDALATSFKSKGQWQHSSSTAGAITWTEDIHIAYTQDTRDVIIRAGSKNLNNEQVAYLDLQRNKVLNGSDASVSWTNGQSYVNTVGGAVGYFANLSKGDWVKKVDDPAQNFLRVEEFYDSVSLGGSTTTAASARSIRLSSTYLGTTEVDRGRYDKGVYQPSDVVVSAKNTNALTASGGNFHWMAARSDTVENISSINSLTVTGTVDDADGTTAKVTAAGHGLVDGDYITLTAPLAHAGTYVVEVEDNNVFYIQSSSTALGALTGYYGLCNTAAYTNGYGLQLESANHGFNSGDTVIFAGTTNFNASKLVNKRSATQIQFAANGNFAAETVGTATLAKVIIRAEQGLLKIVQGENANIGQAATQNMMGYMGMLGPAEGYPNYYLPSGYNTLAGTENFNSGISDNLTVRVSKLTAMMADRVQDRGSKVSGRVTVQNVGSGGNQILDFGGSIFISMPGGDIQNVALGTVSVAVNQAVTVTVNRNASATPSLVVENISHALVAENKIVLFVRYGDTSVFSWDGVEILNSTRWTGGDYETSQNRNLFVVDSGGIAYDTATDIFTFAFAPASIEVVIPGAAVTNTVDTTAINALSSGLRTMVDGEMLWLRVNRLNNKTFNLISNNPTDQDDDANGLLYITANSDVPTDQEVIVLYSVVNGSLAKLHSSSTSGNVYEEIVSVVAPITASSTLTLPVDSRNFSSIRYYIVGSGDLQLYLNGQRLVVGSDYSEDGAANSSSNTVTILQDLVIGDVLTYSIPLFGSSGGAGGLTDPTTSAGDLIYRTALNVLSRLPAGTTSQVLTMTAPSTVGWANNPAGFSDPMTTAGDLLYKNSGGTTTRLPIGSPGQTLTVINSTTVAWQAGVAESQQITLTNTSGSSIAALKPVRVDLNGDMNTIDVSTESNVKGVVGIATATVANGSSGGIVTSGRLLNIGGSFSFGDILYIDKNGNLSNIVPDIGVGSPPFAGGDWVIKIGVVSKNQTVPTDKDLILQVQIMGQL